MGVKLALLALLGLFGANAIKVAHKAEEKTIWYYFEEYENGLCNNDDECDGKRICFID
jgi:hypothetical protein